MQQSYMTRALRARDPRFRTILAKLGYDTREAKTAEPRAPSEVGAPTREEPKGRRRRGKATETQTTSEAPGDETTDQPTPQSEEAQTAPED